MQKNPMKVWFTASFCAFFLLNTDIKADEGSNYAQQTSRDSAEEKYQVNVHFQNPTNLLENKCVPELSLKYLIGLLVYK